MQLSQFLFAFVSLLASIQAVSLFAVQRNANGDSEVIMNKRTDTTIKAIEPMQKRSNLTARSIEPMQKRSNLTARFVEPMQKRGNLTARDEEPLEKRHSFNSTHLVARNFTDAVVKKRFADADEALANGKAKLFI